MFIKLMFIEFILVSKYYFLTENMAAKADTNPFLPKDNIIMGGIKLKRKKSRLC